MKYSGECAEARRQRQMQVQRAEYEVEIARRRYEATDPSNRLVAAELEARWEQALEPLASECALFYQAAAWSFPGWSRRASLPGL